RSSTRARDAEGPDIAVDGDRRTDRRAGDGAHGRTAAKEKGAGENPVEFALVDPQYAAARLAPDIERAVGQPGDGHIPARDGGAAGIRDLVGCQGHSAAGYHALEVIDGGGADGQRSGAAVGIADIAERGPEGDIGGQVAGLVERDTAEAVVRNRQV